MKIDNPIHIVRALWGSSKKVLDEIPKIPLFKNETVFVWGLENKEYLKSLGYIPVLVKDNVAKITNLRELHPDDAKGVLEEHLHTYTGDHRYSTPKLHFAHKLEALRLADNMFGEYLFLDWDIDIIKPLDSLFFDHIKRRGSFQVPLYAYHEDWLREAEQKENLDKDTQEFVRTHNQLLNKYSWKLNNLRICPNACFIYSNNQKIGTKLLDIFNDYNLEICIEEFATYLFTNCSLEEYIDRYLPIVLNGRETEPLSEGMNQAIKDVNKFTDTLVKKQLYLHHYA